MNGVVAVRRYLAALEDGSLSRRELLALKVETFEACAVEADGWGDHALAREHREAASRAAALLAGGDE